jgi:hypothetical protein
MTRLLAAILAMVTWAGPTFAEPSNLLKNIEAVSYVVSVEGEEGECKVDAKNLETSLRFLANSSRLKFFSSKRVSEEMPTLFFDVAFIGTGRAQWAICSTSIIVSLIAPAYSVKLKASNVELFGLIVPLWRHESLWIAPPGDFSASTIAKCEEFLKEFVNDWSASQ